MRLIDADEAKLALIASKAKHMAHNEILSADEDEIMGFLDHMKTVDAVPVIRCSECKHFGKLGEADVNGNIIYYNDFCLLRIMRTVPSFYCADGVRKDD